MRFQPRSIVIVGGLAAALVVAPPAMGSPPDQAQGNGPPDQAQGNGPPDQAQGNGPPSTQQNGANQSPGPYTPPTSGPGAPGNPSGNGGGNDANSGNRPAAGTVGNADGKNPPGQYPNGGDSNNGYECDGNSGVGKMNPAHSGCGPGPTSNPPENPPENPPKNPPENPPNNPPENPPGGSSNPPGGNQPAQAPAGDVQGESETSPTEEVANPTPVASQPEAAPRRPDEGALPFTGSEPLALVLLGLLTLAVGLGLSRALRPRSLD